MNATDLGDEPAKAGMMENLRVKLARYVFFSTTTTMWREF